MIKGLGIDSVQVNRIRKAARRWGRSFLKRLFTDREIAYCMKHANPYPSLAARFAAKEALIKALDAKALWKWRNMEVMRSSSGKPEISLTGPARAFAKRRSVRAFRVSLTHDADRATAVVLAVR
jgi:holo-[acyl-carrier protein] synthase